MVSSAGLEDLVVRLVVRLAVRLAVRFGGMSSGCVWLMLVTACVGVGVGVDGARCLWCALWRSRLVGFGIADSPSAWTVGFREE